jgi:hypothetical protein
MLCLTLASGAQAFTVTVESEGAGASGGGEYALGDSVTISAGTAVNKKFGYWTYSAPGGGNVAFTNYRSATTKFAMPQADVTVTAHFSETATDARDGKVYGVTTIGSRKWLTENLNYQPASGNSWCYGNSADSCKKYGSFLLLTSKML